MNENHKMKNEKKSVYLHKNIRNLASEKSLDRCSRHGKKYLIEEPHSGDMVCTKCGVIVCERMVSEEAEWRNFGDDSMADKWKRSRVGGAMKSFLSDEANLGTSIRLDGAANGSNFVSSVKRHYSRRSVDRALIKAHELISTTCSRIHLAESVIYRAQDLYTTNYRQLKLKGNIQFVDAKVPACIYIACRQENVPRTSKEIAQISETSTNELRRAIKRMLLGLKINLEPLDTSLMIDRFVKGMELSPHDAKAVQKAAKQISMHTKTPPKMGKNFAPETIIGGQIFLALQQTNSQISEKDLQMQIAAALGISAERVERSSRLLSG